jgi:DHA3 family macrolide efflux protein-like MFS transporter
MSVQLKQRGSGLLSFSIAMTACGISVTGTLMTVLGVTIWAWQVTGSAFASGLLTSINYGVAVVLGVLAGAIVDRWSRKFSIILTDIMGALTSGVILFLLVTHHLQVWHLIVFGFILGIQDAFQYPAYFACITMVVSEEQRTRANAMYQMASWSIPNVASAVLAGLLYAFVGLQGILVIDIVTFIVIIGAISCLHIPQPEATAGKSASLLHDIIDGFRYLLRRSRLIWTVLIFTFINVAYGAYLGVFRPMILSLTSNNTVTLGIVLSTVGIGSIVGGVIMGIWPGPKKKVPLMLIGWSLMSACAFVLTGFGRSLYIWVVAAFLQGFFNDIALPLTFAIWQSHIHPAIQGRIMGIVRLVFQGSIPISMVLFTALADRVIVPAMQPGKALASLFGSFLGTGPGPAFALVLIVPGLIFGVFFPLSGFLIPAVRNADDVIQVVESTDMDTVKMDA